MHYRGNRLIGGLAALGMLAPVHAAEWSFEPDITVSTRYDDNLRMSTSNELQATEFSLKPGASFSRASERSKLTGSASFNVRRYDEPDLNTNNSELAVDGHYLTSERSRVNLSANWVKDTTLESELESTGLVLSRTERKNISVSPGFSYILNERLTGNVGANLRRVRYDDDASGLRDYDYNVLNGRLTWQYDRQTSFTGAVAFSRYETANNAFQSDNRQLTLAASHAFTERTRGSLSAGFRKTSSETRSGALDCPAGTVRDITFDVIFFGAPPCLDPDTGIRSNFVIVANTTTNDSSGSVMNASLERELERGSMTLSASRNVSPSASEGLIVSDRISFDLTHRFTEKLKAQLGISWYQSTGTNTAATSADNTFYQIGPSLSWTIDKDLRFSASYRYRKQEREAALESPDSNSISLALSYQWPRVSISR